MKKSNDDFTMKKEYDFSKGTRGRFYSPKKISTTIRLDDDVLLYLKKLASIKKIRYQTLLNSILRDYVQKVAQ
jgi:predicted DNA binding CopG/RHH family protein